MSLSRSLTPPGVAHGMPGSSTYRPGPAYYWADRSREFVPRGTPGNLWLWGNNDEGQLGTGYWEDIDVSFFDIPLLADIEGKVTDIAAGQSHSAVVMETGRLMTCGGNGDGQLGRLEPAVDEETYVFDNVEFAGQDVRALQVVCTRNATFSLVEGGKIYGCGAFYGKEGPMGFSTSVERQPFPKLVYNPRISEPRAVKLAAGSEHVVAILENGSAMTWGNGYDGQLGRISLRHSRRHERRTMLTPTKIPGFRRTRFVDAACGENTTYLMDSHGQWFVCGANHFGQLAVDLVDSAPGEEPGASWEELIQRKKICIVPTYSERLSSVSTMKVAGGMEYALGVAPPDCGLAWGCPEHMTLGREDAMQLAEEGFPLSEPRMITMQGKRVAEVSAGETMAGCIDEDGEAYTWGKGYNPLGLQSAEDGAMHDDVPVPREVRRTALSQNKRFYRLAIGGGHCMLLDDGQ